MKVIAALDLVLGRIERLFLFCANGLLLAMLAINLANILSRLLFDIGLIWVFPWTSVLFVWSIFLAFFVIFRRGQDISIDVLTRRLPERMALRLEIVISCAVIVLLIVILAQVPTLIPRQVGRIDMVGIQRYWLSIPFFFSSFLVMIDYGVKIVHAYLRLRGAGDRDPFPSGTGAGGVGACRPFGKSARPPWLLPPAGRPQQDRPAPFPLERNIFLYVKYIDNVCIIRNRLSTAPRANKAPLL